MSGRLIWIVVLFLGAGVVPGAQDQPQAGKGADEKPSAAAAPAEGGGRPAELKALERLAGVWDVEILARQGGDSPESKPVIQKGKAVEAMEWVLDSSFLAGRSSGESGKTLSAWMWGFDRGTNTYRLWWFGVGGQVTEWAGAYDPNTQTFTLRTQAAGGYQSTAIIKFVDDNTRTQTVIVRDPTGNSTQRIEATMRRRK